MTTKIPYNVMRHASWDFAPRDPVTIGSLILTGSAAAGAAATGIVLAGYYAVGFLATTALTSVLSRALAPKIGGQNKGTLFNVKEPVAPQRYIYGQVRTGGVLTYAEATGENNKYLHQIIVLAGHVVEEIGDIYVNDKRSFLSGLGKINYTINATYRVSGRNYEKLVSLYDATTSYADAATLTKAQLEALMDETGFDRTGMDYRSGKVLSRKGDEGYVKDSRWKNKVLVRKFDGTQTAPPAELLADSTQINANFVGTGIAYLYVRLEHDTEAFANGVPVITAVVKGKKVTNTSGVAQTYPASANAALVIRDYLKSEYGLADQYIDDVYFGSAANDCNDNIPLAAGGTEKRYQINGVVNADSEIGQTLQDMVTACNGTLYLSGGQWRLKVGVYEPSQKSFTLDDLRSDINFSTKKSRRDNFNKVIGKFVYGGVYDATYNALAGDWVEADYPAISSAAFLSEDNNIENIIDLPLLMVTSSPQAQRVAKQTLFRSREQITISADFGTRAINLEVGDIIDLTISDYGWTNKEFEVASWILLVGDTGGIRVRMTLRETSEAAFDWDAEESDIINNNSSLPQYWIVPTPTFTSDVVTETIITPDGTTYSVASVEWSVTTPEVVDHYIVAYNISSETDEQRFIMTGTRLDISDAEIGEEYTIRVTAVNSLGLQSDTAVITATIPADTTPPSAPTSLSTTSGYTQINVKWTNPTQKDLKEIRVFSSTTNNSATSTQVGVVSGDTFSHTGLPQSTTRFYWAKAVDFTGNVSAFSAATSGTTLANPTNGETGDTIVTGRVYYQTLQASAPATPTASSYNTSTGAFVGLTAGWALTQPSVSITDTTVKEWSSQYQVTIDGTTSAQTIAFTTPAGAIQVTADIESDNYVPGSSGWHIERDTGNAEFQNAIIRGTLNASDITAGTLNASRINIDGVTLDTSAGQLVIKTGGVATANIAARAATDATVATSGTLTLTATGSTSLGTFTTTENSQFIILQASANVYGTGTGVSYSLGISIDGTTVSTFINSATDSYATYNDLRFPVVVTDRRIVASAGSHTVGLTYVIASGSSLEVTNFDVVITLLKR